ncbi:MAG: MFS transporter [Anaerolineae bacterium]|nr:MAG: MFS transporter [Anaerolineae bacterium]
MPKNPLNFLTPVLRWFLGTMILANTAGHMLLPLMAVYLARDLGASVGQVGLIFTLASLVPLALQILGGWLSDTIGRLKAIAIGASVATVGYIVLLFANSWQMAMVALMLEYVSGALVGPSYGAFIADQSAEAVRGRVFGLMHTIFAVVGVIGPPLGGWVADAYGFKVLIWAAALLYGSAAVLRIWMALTPRFREKPADHPDSRPSLASLRASLGSLLALVVSGGVFTWLILTDGVRDIAFRMSFEFQSLYFNEIAGLTLTQIGLLGSIMSLARMLVMTPAGGLSDRIGERRTIMLGFALQAAGMGLFLWAGGFIAYALAWVVLGVGFGIADPAFDALFSKVVPQERRGVAFGLFGTSLGLISLPAPYIGARLWETFSPRLPFILTTLAAAFSLVPVYFKLRLPEAAVPETPDVVPAAAD